MSYYIPNDRAVLGVSAGVTAAVSAGANVFVPGSGPIVAVSVGVLDSLFGGKGEDAARQARVDWFEQAVRQGSPLAGQFLIGGLTNTGSNERPMFEKAIQRLLADPASAPTMRAAQSAGPWWDTRDDRWSSKSRAAVETELLQLADAQASRPSTSIVPARTAAPAVQQLGAQLPQSFDWKPWALGAAGLAVAVFVLPQIIRPSRSR